MRLSTAVFVWFLPILVTAGGTSRGLEALFFYQAYRMDVDISSAVARDNGDDPEKTQPWKIANNLPDWKGNEDADFPDGYDRDGRLGLTWHAFITHTGKSHVTVRKHSRRAVADPFNPTMIEVSAYDARGLSRWDPDHGGKLGQDRPDKKDENKFSFTGFDPAKVMGKLSAFGDFHEAFGTIGGRIETLKNQKPDMAADYMDSMRNTLAEATRARQIEDTAFMSDITKKKVKDLDSKHANNRGLAKTVDTETRDRLYSDFGGSVYNSQEFRDEFKRVKKVSDDADVKVKWLDMGRLSRALFNKLAPRDKDSGKRSKKQVKLWNDKINPELQDWADRWWKSEFANNQNVLHGKVEQSAQGIELQLQRWSGECRAASE